MYQKAYFGISATIFFIMAAGHLCRLIVGWELELGRWTVPHWVSVPGLIFPALLSLWGWRLALRK